MRRSPANPRTRTILAAASLSALLTACAGLPDAGTEEAQLYSTKCGGCHSPVNPARYQYFQWERLLTLMERGLNHQQMKGGLSSDEKARLLPYLKQHAAPDQEQRKKLYDLDSKIM
ncbi:MAG: hypothetical protein AB1810_12100 [Pseudomonadota bacterium]